MIERICMTQEGESIPKRDLALRIESGSVTGGTGYDV